MGMVHPVCPSKEGQDDLHLPDRRNLPSIHLMAQRAPQHHNSNQGDKAGNPPERGNERDKERKRKRQRGRQREKETVRKRKEKRGCARVEILIGD